MRHSVLLLTVVASAFVSSVAIAERPATIPDNIVKELSSLVGTWEVEGKIGDVTQTGHFTCRWAKGEDGKKCCVVGRFCYDTDGKIRSGVTLIGWNAVKECIEDRGFDGNGGNARLLWTVESPTKWLGDVSIVADGKEVKQKAVLIKKGSKEIVCEGELETGETSRFVFRKVEGKPKRKTKE